MDDLSMKRLERKLSPEEITANLQLAAMYLVAYELLRRAIVDEVKGFYMVGFSGETWRYNDDEYDAEVLSRHKKVFEASCLWLANQGVFEESDVAELQCIREHRDRIAHELPSLMVDPAFDVDPSLLIRVRHYLGLVGRFWGSVNASLGEIPVDEIDYDGITSMSMLLLDHIMSVVGGVG
jgi:hypothetical protein